MLRSNGNQLKIKVNKRFQVYSLKWWMCYVQFFPYVLVSREGHALINICKRKHKYDKMRDLGDPIQLKNCSWLLVLLTLYCTGSFDIEWS